MDTIFEGVDGCARKMKHACKFIDFFIGDILDYSVLNEASENFKKDNKTFDIRKSITTVVDIVTDKSIMKTIRIKTDLQYLDDGLQSHLVNTDEKRLNQVLFNLVNNALKYTPRNGLITIKVDKVLEFGKPTHLKI